MFPSQGRCTISWGSTTAQCARAASVGALKSASTPSSTNRSAPPWRHKTLTGAWPDNTSPQTAIEVRWLMSHHVLPLDTELKHYQSAFSFIFLSCFLPFVRQTPNKKWWIYQIQSPPLAAENENLASRSFFRNN